MSKLGQEPAFPSEVAVYENGVTYMQTGNNSYQDFGMSKRFYAACAAMQGILSSGLANPSQPIHFINIVEDAYKFADELLKQENE